MLRLASLTACCALITVMSVTAAAQVYAVKTDDAAFMDGATQVAPIRRGTEFYALGEQDGWEPRIRTRSVPPSPLRLRWRQSVSTWTITGR